MRKLVSIHVSGRRWWQRSYGNTYCSAIAYANYSDGTSEQVNIPRQYGYGDFYVQAAADALQKAGHLPGRKPSPNGGHEPLWTYCNDRGISFTYEACDVPREKDLHSFRDN